jgi:hypothetical protein
MKKKIRNQCDAVEAFSDSEGHIRQAITYLARGMRRMNEDTTCKKMIKKLEKIDEKLKKMIIEISFKMD